MSSLLLFIDTWKRFFQICLRLWFFYCSFLFEKQPCQKFRNLSSQLIIMFPLVVSFFATILVDQNSQVLFISLCFHKIKKKQKRLCDMFLSIITVIIIQFEVVDFYLSNWFSQKRFACYFDLLFYLYIPRKLSKKSCCVDKLSCLYRCTTNLFLSDYSSS